MTTYMPIGDEFVPQPEDVPENLRPWAAKGALSTWYQEWLAGTGLIAQPLAALRNEDLAALSVTAIDGLVWLHPDPSILPVICTRTGADEWTWWNIHGEGVDEHWRPMQVLSER